MITALLYPCRHRAYTSLTRSGDNQSAPSCRRTAGKDPVADALGWGDHLAYLGGFLVDTMTPVYSSGTLLVIAAVAVFVPALDLWAVG